MECVPYAFFESGGVTWSNGEGTLEAVGEMLRSAYLSSFLKLFFLPILEVTLAQAQNVQRTYIY